MTDNEWRDKFPIFWMAWPKKVGKKMAEKAWAKVKPRDTDMFIKLVDSLEEHKRYSKKWEGGYIPHCATWLNQERWDDEVIEPSKASFKHSSQSSQEADSEVFKALGYQDKDDYEAHFTRQAIERFQKDPKMWIKRCKTTIKGRIDAMPEGAKNRLRTILKKGLDSLSDV